MSDYIIELAFLGSGSLFLLALYTLAFAFYSVVALITKDQSILVDMGWKGSGLRNFYQAEPYFLKFYSGSTLLCAAGIAMLHFCS